MIHFIYFFPFYLYISIRTSSFLSHTHIFACICLFILFFSFICYYSFYLFHFLLHIHINLYKQFSDKHITSIDCSSRRPQSKSSPACFGSALDLSIRAIGWRIGHIPCEESCIFAYDRIAWLCLVACPPDRSCGSLICSFL